MAARDLVTLQWVRHTEDLPAGRCDDDGDGGLEIRNVQRQDSGVYICVARYVQSVQCVQLSSKSVNSVDNVESYPVWVCTVGKICSVYSVVQCCTECTVCTVLTCVWPGSGRG